MLGTGDDETVASRYGLGSGAVLAGPVARGEVGQVWRLTTSRGVWAVKEPFEPPSVDEANDDAEYQDMVFDHGVLIPKVVRTTSGDVLADVGSAVVRMYEWVDLLSRDPWLDPATVGRIVASIHRVHHIGVNPVDPWYTDPVGADRWDDLIRQVAAADAPFAGQLAGLRDELLAQQELLEWPSVLQTCHRDLFADNVLRTPSGAVCVIDWENTGLADPSQELGLVLFEFGRGDPTRARALYDAYMEAGGPGRIERPGNFSMVIAQISHIGENACEAWLDSRRLAERQHHEGRVDEFVTDGITRRMIDDIVDALAS